MSAVCETAWMDLATIRMNTTLLIYPKWHLIEKLNTLKSLSNAAIGRRLID